MPGALEQQIRSGAVAGSAVTAGGYAEQASQTLAAFEADSVETVRLVFADQHGILRGKTVVGEALASVFANGIGLPSTLLLKDTAHRTVFPVWSEEVVVGDQRLTGAGDVVAVPDPLTARKVPWAPHSRMILCHLVDQGGVPIAVSSRAILSKAVSALDAAGFQAVMGLEVEFQIFEKISTAQDHADATMPPAPVATRNLTQGWQYLTETRYGEAEPILDLLRRTAQDMELGVRTIEVEMGPSQFEFTFGASDPMTQADRFVLFRTMVKEVCHQRGLHASFMAKPKLPNAAANGWHMHQSLLDKRTGNNPFLPSGQGALSKEAAGWLAGLLDHAAGACLLTTPTVNGYKRFAPFQLAPNRVAWGYDNRGAMVRALLTPGDPASRIENRVADPTANPYFAFAAQILSGLDGIERGAEPPPPTISPYADDAARLPQSLIAAVDAFDTSALFRTSLGPAFVDYLVHIKRAEWERYLMTVSEWEQSEYFSLF